MSSKSIVPISQYPTVNEYGIIVLLGHVWVYVGKRKGFRRGRRENEFERKRKHRDVYRICKN